MSHALSNATTDLFMPLSARVFLVETPSLCPPSYQVQQHRHTALAALQDIATHHTHTAYFLQFDREPNQAHRNILLQVLCPQGGLTAPSASCAHTLVFWVTPRLTTLSPWSSKATQLLRNACGVSCLARIETGQVHHLAFKTKAGLLRAKKALKSPTTPTEKANWPTWIKAFFDPLTETILTQPEQAQALFTPPSPQPLAHIPLMEQGLSALKTANTTLGCALTEADMHYLMTIFTALKRDPTDVEIMMFAQANSEHCRHKIFRSTWDINGVMHTDSLFDAIKQTYRDHPNGVRSAYHDNGAVLMGHTAHYWDVCPTTRVYVKNRMPCPIVIKVETHNHPTAIAPWPGAATGTGGEIRDEAAVGQGGYSKAGLAGFMVSDLHLPTLPQPWETPIGQPRHIQRALDIMLAGPLGSAAFSNEFGRPQIAGFFRTLCAPRQGMTYGYHKPIMLAGGMGHVRPQHIKKKPLPVGAKIIVLGGPALLIGLGGSAASSVQAGQRQADLDFASVQRSHPQMQRRCQAVIDACCALGAATPILAIHDVGAGGLANAIPELLHDAKRGGKMALRAIPCADTRLSPMEIWCNESQERYVLAITPNDLPRFDAIAQREHCPYAVVGVATASPHLLLEEDAPTAPKPVDLPLSQLLDTQQRWHKKIHTTRHAPTSPPHAGRPPLWERTHTPINQRLAAALLRVLQLPCVADKRFLITIGDRSVGGCVVRDPLVGPWQVAVADVAVTANDFTGLAGEAMALGERTPVAITHVRESVRLAIGEAITNLAAAPLARMQDISLSANWMAAAQDDHQAQALHTGVQVARDFCRELGICIPVGKDSLSMQTQWQTPQGEYKKVISPLSLVITAFAPIKNVTQTLTPYCPPPAADTPKAAVLLYVDLSHQQKGLAGSALAQVYAAAHAAEKTAPPPTHPLHHAPDTGLAPVWVAFIDALHACRNAAQDREDSAGYVHAYHDCADGGLITTLCEMLFASRIGLAIDIAPISGEQGAFTTLFHEGPGVVLQVLRRDLEAVCGIFKEKCAPCPVVIGHLTPHTEQLILRDGHTMLLEMDRYTLQTHWSATSQAIEMQRDRPAYVKNAYEAYLGPAPSLHTALTFSPDHAPHIAKKRRPQLAVLREQGTNGHREMAAAWDRAGFRCVDVTMQDIVSGTCDLSAFKGLAACGGFSYGDVLGAGRGWASSVLHHARTQAVFADFFSRSDTFTLGVCNGCQFLSHIARLIPGMQSCPHFLPNDSGRYESRWVMTQIPDSPSILFHGMAGSRLPVIISHGEGRAHFPTPLHAAPVGAHQVHTALFYTNKQGQPADQYPDNPNGSAHGTAGITSAHGRVTLLMPHPERCFLDKQWHWQPYRTDTATTACCLPSPWLRLFENARLWCEQS